MWHIAAFTTFLSLVAAQSCDFQCSVTAGAFSRLSWSKLPTPTSTSQTVLTTAFLIVYTDTVRKTEITVTSTDVAQISTLSSINNSPRVATITANGKVNYVTYPSGFISYASTYRVSGTFPTQSTCSTVSGQATYTLPSQPTLAPGGNAGGNTAEDPNGDSYTNIFVDASDQASTLLKSAFPSVSAIASCTFLVAPSSGPQSSAFATAKPNDKTTAVGTVGILRRTTNLPPDGAAPSSTPDAGQQQQGSGGSASQPAAGGSTPAGSSNPGQASSSDSGMGAAILSGLGVSSTPTATTVNGTPVIQIGSSSVTVGQTLTMNGTPVVVATSNGSTNLIVGGSTTVPLSRGSTSSTSRVTASTAGAAEGLSGKMAPVAMFLGGLLAL